MGDRGNIRVVQYLFDHEVADDGSTPQPRPRLYFYTPWGGTDLPLALQRALRRAWQTWGTSGWGYEGRLAVAIVEELQPSSIGLQAIASDHSELEVDVGPETVTFDPGAATGHLASWSFAEFARLDLDPADPWAVLIARSRER